ncbi:choice-of-anchor M domain-containing protein [Nocardioides sp. SYSU D00038]|uniref:choice-of-anchor M domain-containing protein n=1 Tax=Nocardioides sp. SYSU D00038 TaxID=2812554 RepID=UPI0019681A81|nr:choice-of-anchor M domain-containing protein [Nocardioides sp. SYSU D00038]
MPSFLSRVLPLAALLLLPAAPASADDLSQQIDEGQAVAEGPAVLELGHVDLGPRYVDGDWSLMIHDDTKVEGSVWRSPDRTVVRVADTAEREVPDDPAYAFLGVPAGQPVHVVPQTQDTEVVWLGWNTQDPQVIERVDRGVTLSLAAVEGPGELLVYLQDGGFGAPDVLWDSRATGQPQDLFVDVNTHTHANWVFTRPGTYLVSVTASATLVDGSEETTTRTLRFAVGDETDPQQALAVPPPPAEGAADDPTDPADDPAGAVTADPEGSAASDDEGGLPVLVPVAAGALVLALLAGLVVVRGRRARAAALTGGDR